MVQRNKPVRPAREGIVTGRCEAFCETGTEGIIWSVYEDGKTGYDGLNCLDKGDFLQIFNDVARTDVAWEGEIKLKYPPATRFNRGIQRGVNEKEWSDYFFRERPATVILADTWKKMKAEKRAKDNEQKKTLEAINTSCHDGVPVKPMKKIQIKPKD